MGTYKHQQVSAPKEAHHIEEEVILIEESISPVAGVGLEIDERFRETARLYKTELLEHMSVAASFAAFATGEMPSEASTNLLGVGFGAKSTEGASLEGQLAIRVYVRTKLPIANRYGSRLAFFEGQLAISGVGGFFSDGGDSGSLIVDAVTRRPVALLVGGGSGTTFASPIGAVLDRFNVEIV